jgi:hypothetical protein
MIRTVIAAGALSLALAGAALAAGVEHHVMNVSLPDGAVARIDYQGKVAPKVKILAHQRQQVVLPVAFVDPAAFFAGDPFARMDAMFAAMERRHAAMMRQVAAMAAAASADPGNVRFVSSTNGAPQGGSFTYVSTTTSRNGGCGHTVQITQRAGAEPQRIERSFGDCSAAAAPAPHAAPSHAPVPVQPVV